MLRMCVSISASSPEVYFHESRNMTGPCGFKNSFSFDKNRSWRPLKCYSQRISAWVNLRNSWSKISLGEFFLFFFRFSTNAFSARSFLAFRDILGHARSFIIISFTISKTMRGNDQLLSGDNNLIKISRCLTFVKQIVILYDKVLIKRINLKTTS